MSKVGIASAVSNSEQSEYSEYSNYRPPPPPPPPPRTTTTTTTHHQNKRVGQALTWRGVRNHRILPHIETWCRFELYRLVFHIVKHQSWLSMFAAKWRTNSLLLGFSMLSLGCCARLAGLVFTLVSQLISHLVWDAVPASLVLSFSCLGSFLPACLPSGLGCCVRLAGLVFLLSLVLSPSLSHIWSRMLCPPRSCLSLVSGLVSKLVPSGLGCCVRLAGLVFLLSPVLSPSLSHIWSGVLCPPLWSCHLSLSCLRSCLPACLISGLGCCVRLAGLVFLLSLVLSPSLSPVSAGMLCRACFSPQAVCCWGSPCFLDVSALPGVSTLRACLSLVSGLVSHPVFKMVWDAVSGFLGLSPILSPVFSASLSPIFLSPGLGCCVRLLGCRVRALGLSPKFHVAICAIVWGLRWCNFIIFYFI